MTSHPLPLHIAAARPLLTLTSLTVAALLCMRPVQAADGAAEPSQWGLGLSVGQQSKPYREFDNKGIALPLLMYESRWVSVLGTRADFKLPSAGPVSFRLRARYAVGDGYDAEDSPALRGMANRDPGVWLGGVATWRNAIADVSLEAAGDVSGNSKGTQWRLGVERGFKVRDFEFRPRLAAHGLDRKYVDYYYGVQASEVRADRAFYEGRSTVNTELGLRVSYALAPRQSVFVDVSATSLGDGIKKSSLVDKSTAGSVYLGYLYRF